MDAPGEKLSGPVATGVASASASYTATPPSFTPARQNAPPTVMDRETNTSEDRTRRAASVLSMDDLEAAQALEGLRSGRCHFCYRDF